MTDKRLIALSNLEEKIYGFLIIDILKKRTGAANAAKDFKGRAITKGMNGYTYMYARKKRRFVLSFVYFSGPHIVFVIHHHIIKLINSLMDIISSL